MVLAHAPCHSDSQQLLEEQDDVPVKLGRALHVTTLPGLLHQDRHCPARHEALSLEVSLVAYNQDWHLTATAFPAEVETERGCIQKAVIISVFVTEAGWVCARCLCAVLPFLEGAGVDWRIRAHRLKGPPTTHCSGWFTAL